MDRRFGRFAFRDVVVVADLEDPANSDMAPELRHDLELTGPETLSTLLAAIEGLGLATHHYGSPGELARAARHHREDLVLSIYGGARSRNRMALVPAVCEALGLNYIGPDAYGRIIAQDKELSKRLARECGLLTPAWRVVRVPEDLAFVRGLSLPVVVKPLMEGTSIGIGSRSLQADWNEVEMLASELLERHRQPVLIEEFVAGREVSYNRIESAGDEGWTFSELVIEGSPDYFVSRLFDLEEKLVRKPERTVHAIDGELLPQDAARIERFLTLYGRYGYCRVDGRFSGGKFHFIELTPDAWIDPLGLFAMGFTLNGWRYSDVIAAVLASASAAAQPPSANG